ncbi:MAG: septal ring lytic transglycosylase RlpA family protein [Chitinispirillaceae bacterium]|nr:septal ring lytic transglycosylase RlpA family protein [Chitinispirillaceae bacterium]
MILKKATIPFTLLVFPAIMFLLSGCGGTSRYGRAQPADGQVSSPFRQTGIASYYAKDFHGRATANGEKFDMYALTAAHRTLPFNTRVKVTNLSNGREVTVRINDRGPYVKDRIIDLSFAAAEKIGLIVSGTAKVKIEAVNP